MRKKHDVSFEWRTMDEQADADESPRARSLPPSTRWPRTVPLAMLALGCVLLLAGWWAWRAARTGIHRMEQEVAAAVQAELWLADHDAVASETVLPVERAAVDTDTLNGQVEQAWQVQIAQDQKELPTQLRAMESTPSNASRLHTEVELIVLKDEVAAFEVITGWEGSASAVRQVRFFRRTAGGWHPTSPVAALWGEPRRMETDYFVFHYRRRDEAAVAEVAAQIDAIYSRMLGNFGLAPGTPRSGAWADGTIPKLTYEISLTTQPGMAPVWVNPTRPLRVASPALYQAPLEISGVALLQQSILLPLISQVWAQALDEYGLWLRWQYWQYGLRLWQLWDTDTTLAAYRPAIVRWLYQASIPRIEDRTLRVQTVLQTDTQADILPDEVPVPYATLCAVHRLWMRPGDWGIPLTCTDFNMANREREPASISAPAPSPRRDPPLFLHQFTPPHIISIYPPELEPSLAGEAVAMATLIEYAVHMYGREHLPALLTALGEHDSWDTLAPAVYGRSPAAFEAGWHAYLQAVYGIEVEPPVP